MTLILSVSANNQVVLVSRHVQSCISVSLHVITMSRSGTARNSLRCFALAHFWPSVLTLCLLPQSRTLPHSVEGTQRGLSWARLEEYDFGSSLCLPLNVTAPIGPGRNLSPWALLPGMLLHAPLLTLTGSDCAT